jgi:hypothetical protein
MRRQQLVPIPIKVGGLDLHPILRGLERDAIKATTFGLAAIALYLWLTFIFGRFPFTQPWGRGLAGFLIGLLATFAAGALHALPGLFTVLVIFVPTGSSSARSTVSTGPWSAAPCRCPGCMRTPPRRPGGSPWF